MTILGISDSHNAAAAALLPDGSLRALQEERPRRIKNFHNIPTMAIEWLLKELSIKPADVECVALAGMPSVPLDRAGWIEMFRNAGSWKGQLRTELGKTPLRSVVESKRLQEREAAYTALGFRPEALKRYDHHTCHAATAYYGQAERKEPVLVLTVDGGGDGKSATVSIGQDNKLRQLHEVPYADSFGTLYAVVTYMLGMVPLEHEYKIMGMAPYAAPAGSRRIADKLHELFHWVNDKSPVWTRASGVPHTLHIKPKLEELFYEQRFDNIMGGVQLFTEELLCEFVRRAIAETGIHRLALSGGVFMNVKANKRIMEMDEVESLFIFPSCGDETNAIGAAWLAQAERHGAETIRPIGPFYLGPEWSEAEIEADLAEDKANGSIIVTRPENINQAVADLLAQGHVVGRFAGREEFGARSLGNRAILGDPRDAEIIREINEMVKSRDFWMPFASSVAAEYADVYLKNPKSVAAPYMILSFDTTEAGGKLLKAGIHPYDRTCRPQVVTKEINPDYWDLIHRFAEHSGVGAVLNTSLNLHGLPLVHFPRDAVHVLKNSGLNWVAIGPYLVTKPAS
ncbi:carbamoyltransferase C-terminal domain-containing protein [Xanthobacter sp. TB0136]|uniref:carbamoyltransferase C-terminal domain-containing protein n=1 Tax=Xanthobacter sp. TB0136 TaxID=3459177 RepID=UPI004039F144